MSLQFRRASFYLLSIWILIITTNAQTCKTRQSGGEAKCSQAGTFNTFDGATLHFNSSNRYTLVRPCPGMYEDKPDTEIYTLEWFVDVQNKALTLPSTSKEVIYAEVVQIIAYNHVIELREFGEVMIDKQEPILPINIKEGKITLFRKGWKVVMNTDFGLQVSFDARGAGGQHLVEIELHNPDYACRLCGVCGTWNGNREDDLIPRGGRSRIIDTAVVESWLSEDFIGKVQML